jgi:two-component system, sporulation sensor kinase D
LYYEMSPELKQLQYFPYIQFAIIGLFVFISYLIFSTFRKAEQNQVWAGMAKETAHQLGTPISSLMAWIQLIETQDIDPMIPREMHKDVERLEKITDRFSKIGSGGKLEAADLSHTVKSVLDYLQLRISDKVNIHFTAEEEVIALHNPSLMEWVVENICKNAVDAMGGAGDLTVTVHKTPEWAHIDIKDTGKGIPPKQLKTIFQPGYTTKKRGWGLGLSLVKRIIQDYHKGKVFVLESQIDVGTTFRISVPM